MNRTLLACLSALAVAAPLRGQEFVNLDFESAQVIVTTNSAGFIGLDAGSALPGWSAFSGTNQLSLVDYDPSTLVVPGSVGLFGSNADVIDGNFGVFLHGDGSISQTGLVPSGT